MRLPTREDARRAEARERVALVGGYALIALAAGMLLAAFVVAGLRTVGAA